MSEQERSQLESQAAQALRSGQLEEALELYRRLEEIDPQAICWPKRRAEVCRELRLPEQELEALLRAGDLYNAEGYFVKAVEMFRLVLAIDPFNAAAAERLSGLKPVQATSVSYSDEMADPDGAGSGAGAQPEVADSNAPLEELVLTDVVPGSRPAPLAELDHGGISEIPLDDPADADGHELTELSPAVDNPTRDPRKWLARAPLFAPLDARVIDELARGARVVELSAGCELFHQGDGADALYMVAQGAVVPIAEGRVRRKLAVLETGEFFGEIALFTHQPRNATIQALVDSQLVRIDRATVRKLVAKRPQVLARLLRFARQRLVHRLVKTSPLFEVLDKHERGRLVAHFRFLEVADATSLVNQHAPAEALFLVLAGRLEAVHLDRDGEKTLGTYGPGDMIGQMSLVSREPSLASVVARGKCWVLALSANSFYGMLESYPQVKAVLARILEEREKRNQRKIRNEALHREDRIDLI